MPGGAVVKNPPANAGTRVQALVWEDPTCRGAPVPQLLSLRSRPREQQLLSPRATATADHVPRACAPQQREATAVRSPRTTTKSSSNEDPTQPKIK